MSVSLDDLADPENSLDINMWNWRPTIALIGLTRLIDDERLELMGYNGTGVEITEAEARAIGRFLETEVLPALRPGTRLTYDLSVTDAPDDHTFHHDDFAKNYSASYEWLTRFAQFCGTCSGFRVL